MNGCGVASGSVTSTSTRVRAVRRAAVIACALIVAIVCTSPAGAVMVVDATDGLVTHPGAGFGGANASRLQNLAFQVSSLGHTASAAQGFRVADDVTLTQPAIIQSVTVFAYQTGSTTMSTFDRFHFQIWNGNPTLPGSSVIFGDVATNRYSSSAFTGIYRDSEAFPGVNDRPIMSVTASGLSIPLGAGTYWLDFDTGGTLGSGPYVPGLGKVGLLSLPGANALQWSEADDAWTPLDDASVGVQPVAIGMQLNGVAAPTIASGATTGLTASGATLTGSINPGDAATTYHVEYGRTTAYGATTPSNVLAAGSAPAQVQVKITGLAKGRTYHARIVAQNSAGITVGPDIAFGPKLTLGRVTVHPARARSGRGLALRFALSAAAQVTVVLDRIVPGRRRADTCRPSARKGPRCTVYVLRATLNVTRQGGAGTRVAIAARLGGRTLAPGRYRITVIARDAATHRVSNTRRVTFTVRA